MLNNRACENRCCHHRVFRSVSLFADGREQSNNSQA